MIGDENKFPRLYEIKKDVLSAVKAVGLASVVSLEEIEKEIYGVETAFTSPLLLGILSRIMHTGNEKAAKLFMPAVTEWKNYLPHEDLDGMTPVENLEKYPPGRYESRLISALMYEYQRRLEELGKSPEYCAKADKNEFDVGADFDDFQKEYFNRIPSDQPFMPADRKFMTVREIIMVERRANGRPEKDIDTMGIKVSIENTAEGLGSKIAEFEDTCIGAVKELSAMQAWPRLRNRKRVREIRKLFARDEPYHRCAAMPHQFYFNYATVVFLDDGDMNEVRSLLDRALTYKPDYDYALKMKRTLGLYSSR